MPLLLPVLTEALIKMDEPTPPKTPEATAEAWTNAWWTYAKDMSYWTPGMEAVIKAAAYPAFKTALLPGCIPNMLPGTFYLAYETASLAGWAAGGVVPGALLPAYAPGIVPMVPAPGALSLALVATVPVGLASPVKQPVRAAMALAISIWTVTLGVVPVGGPPPVPLL